MFENWMAHQGSAKKLLRTLRHDHAPEEVIILSGDVHYSFCFSAQRRFKSNSGKIWQLTCSGFKNEFPTKLLKAFNFLDRILYSPKSPLNIFTKDENSPYNIIVYPEQQGPSKSQREHLHSESAGLVQFTSDGKLDDFQLLEQKMVASVLIWKSEPV